MPRILFPGWGPGVAQVWRRNFLQFRYIYIVTLVWILLEPTFYLASIGYGLGSFVSHIDGMSYAEFFFPGLLCTTAMMVPFFESTYNNYTKLTHQKTYSSMLLSPIDTDEIFWGEILWATTKGMLGVVGVAIIAKLFGAYDTWMVIPSLFVLFLSCLTFSGLGMLFTTYATNYDSFIYSTSGLVIPMSLFSGTYYPIDTLPAVIKWVTYLFPMSHSVIAVRHFLHRQFDMEFYLHLGVLAAMAAVFLIWSYNRFVKKLIN